jgi:hypothetical protein
MFERAKTVHALDHAAAVSGKDTGKRRCISIEAGGIANWGKRHEPGRQALGQSFKVRGVAKFFLIDGVFI